MKLVEILNQLSSGARSVPAENAESLVPTCPGLYSIAVDDSASLPAPFSQYAARSGTSMLYLGKASGNLQNRLVREDLRHRRASTFFRGIGAILGYVPPRGSLKGKRNQRNYKFSQVDTENIIGWINAHISVRWVTVTPAEVELYEGEAIAALRPLLNWTHNPDRLRELQDLRRRCESMALS